MSGNTEDKFKAIIKEIVEFIKKCVEDANAEGVVVGVSGGIDSACVAKLCTIALGKDKVFALIMPEKEVTPKEDIEDAINLCDILGIERKVIEISPAVSTVCELVGLQKDLSKHFKDNIDDKGPAKADTNIDLNKKRIAYGNIKPRVRMILLYYHANIMSRIVAGTGNKSELLAGYFTKYGDGGVDILPIGDLYKTEVFKLAELLEIPERIRMKKPSARLWTGQTDEEEMGISYLKLDAILKTADKLDLIKEIELNGRIDKIVAEIYNAIVSGQTILSEKISKKEIEYVVKMIKNSMHKRSEPPIAKIRDLIE